jgi:predicted dehydrogenase
MPAIRANVNAPRFVEAYRLGPFTKRAADIDVVKDLMIHDIDILQQLLGEEPVRIESIGIAVVSDNIDIANARLGFRCGCVASLTASRIAPTPTRRLRFYQPDGFISIDFLEPTASISRRIDARDGAGPRIEVEEFKIDPEDALLAQLRAFVEAVKTRQLSAASGVDGLGALRTALRVVEAMPSAHDLS